MLAPPVWVQLPAPLRRSGAPDGPRPGHGVAVEDVNNRMTTLAASHNARSLGHRKA
jgi:hypothetical protein